MKKIGLLIFSIILATSCVFADCNKTNAPVKEWYSIPPQQKSCDKPIQKPCDNPCEKKMYTRECPKDTFLCTGKEIDELFKCIGLSETQICNAKKFQDKYETEVLSLNERIKCEQKNLYEMKKACNKGSEYRKTKKVIKDLKSERKKICKCYEKQFKETLSDEQRHSYNKYTK